MFSDFVYSVCILGGCFTVFDILGKINKKEITPPKTKTFKRDSFKENRSSKVSSFKTTNLYLSVSFCLKDDFFGD